MRVNAKYRVIVKVSADGKLVRTVQEWILGAAGRTNDERRADATVQAIGIVKARCGRSGAYAGKTLTFSTRRY